MDDIYVWIIVIVLVALVGVAIGSRFVAWYGEFQKELSVINAEIARNTGREKRHWKKRKRRLLLSILPFRRY